MKPMEIACRWCFWTSAIIGIYATFQWIGHRLGSWYALGLFIVPFWIAGVFYVVRELRSGRGKGLRNHSLYQDRPVD